MAANKSNKLGFLSMPAPASYVAGLGRGASGFTTRSDIGPAREGPSAETIAEAQAKRGEENQEFDPDQFTDPDNEFGLFRDAQYEADDEEADKIYDTVDKAMDSRRSRRREIMEKEEMDKTRKDRPKIQQQFSDLKRGLSSVTDEEWDGIPEVGNLTRRKRKKIGEDRSFAVPDSILVGDRAKGEVSNVDNSGMDTATTSYDGAMTNFVEIGQARDKILSLKLDQMSGTQSALANSGTASSVDPKGYLTSLDSVVIKSDAEIGDIKRARTLFDSLVKSNPKHAPGWIAAACLEEHAGRMVAARKLIKQGCEACPKAEDVWLEAARLHSTSDAKIVLANAIQHVPQSVKIWLAAADLEGTGEASIPARRRVLRRALEHIPTSVRLWKETVNLESSPADARLLLSRAVEVIPKSVELWLALARLEIPEKSRAVLNKARKAVPTSHEIWIAAGRLLEQGASSAANLEAELEKVDKTIEAGVAQLRKHQVLLTREQWLKEAEKCEEEGSMRTCEAIVKGTIGMELDEDDPEGMLSTFIADAESSEAHSHIHTARSILSHALKVFPDRASLWSYAADIEKTHGTAESLIAILDRAIQHCPQSEVLWLMNAKERWLGLGDVQSARDILHDAFQRNPESEQIWLAAVKVEAESGEFDLARELLVRARSVADTERIWMKSAVFERQQGRLESSLETLKTAIGKFPKFPKLYMMQGQIYQHDLSTPNYPLARNAYNLGYKQCPKEPALWILASRLEEADGKSIRARSLLDKARQLNPNVDVLWAESVGVEERSGGLSQAKTVLARALQDCPTSGILWSMAIWMEPRPQRKAKSVDALKKSSDDPIIICTVARLFWAERKIEKARQWFERAVGTGDGEDIGDVWGWWLKFERQHGEKERQEKVIKDCVAKDPKHGIVWQATRKSLNNSRLGTAEILEKVVDELR